MWTESFMQMVDRAIIERLKQIHYSEKERPEEARQAGQQADKLMQACESYFTECLDGTILPNVGRHLRFHNHRTKGCELPTTLVGCISQLASVHAEYWETQTLVQAVKKRVDAARGPEKEKFCHSFYDLQLVLDACNQSRSEIRQRGDEILCELLGKRYWWEKAGESPDASSTLEFKDMISEAEMGRR